MKCFANEGVEPAVNSGVSETGARQPLASRRTQRWWILWAAGVFLLAVALTAFADFTAPGGNYRTAREADSGNTPTWPVDAEFRKDLFTFARGHYTVDGRYGFGSREERWAIDFPRSDLNFSFRLQQMTSVKVDPDGRVVKITEKELFDYPFLYIVEPGRMTLSDEEVKILRKYLLNGGFVMFDDFWGDREWENFEEEMKRLFPDRKISDIPLTHPIFQAVFALTEKPQVPGIPHALRGRTHERGADGEEVHYRGIFDDKGRLMVMICHNTDLGDGWEREGDNQDYFNMYSEKKAYPMGINILVYAMTH
jgi:hypothetical protein